MSAVPLPEPTPLGWDYERHADGEEVYGYTADQMRAYGAACAAAQRERDAKVCDDMALYTGFDCAKAIREA